MILLLICINNIVFDLLVHICSYKIRMTYNYYYNIAIGIRIICFLFMNILLLML